MRLRADWLSRVLNVPYVPILGLAHPDQFTAEMFTDVFADILIASRTGTALPFDKDRRWSPRKTDAVLIDEIVHRPDHTIIPILSRRGGGTIKTFYYGDAPNLDHLRAATRHCCAIYGAANGRVVWFDTVEATDVDRTRVLLKEFTHGNKPDEPPGSPIVGELDDDEPETAATFSVFAHAMADHGFDYLRQRRDAGHRDGPVLVSQDNGVIVGAIGPLTIMPDRAGARMLLPQYFGVLPEYRGGGHGRALWRAAQRWGVRHHADYQLLQARVGAASERLFLAEGLRSLGFTATVAA
jgi:GNAT superfamily N-acetyltransferase